MELKYGEGLGIAIGNLLLIVPYGIEIFQTGTSWKCILLLIVPYGIEI